jgi:hypothetical protein
VSRIFVSHSSAGNGAAAALKRRLAARRPELVNEMIVFDIDPGSGLQLGSLGASARCSTATSRGAAQHRRGIGLDRRTKVQRLIAGGDH